MVTAPEWTLSARINDCHADFRLQGPGRDVGFFFKFPRPPSATAAMNVGVANAAGALSALYKRTPFLLNAEIEPRLGWMWLVYNRLPDATILTRGRRVTAESFPIRQPGRLLGELPVGMLFGGGKDSLYAASCFVDALGPGAVQLVTLEDGVITGRTIAEDRERISVRPATEMRGVAAIFLQANIAGEFRRAGLDYRVRHNRYLSLLPYLHEAHGIGTATLSLECTHFFTRLRSRFGSRPTFSFAGMRPEYTGFVAETYREIFQFPAVIMNANATISERMSFEGARASRAAAAMMMCEQGLRSRRERYCYDCKKCLEFAIFSSGDRAADFDYDRMFSSAHVDELLKAGPGRWTSQLGADYHAASAGSALREHAGRLPERMRRYASGFEVEPRLMKVWSAAAEREHRLREGFVAPYPWPLEEGSVRRVRVGNRTADYEFDRVIDIASLSRFWYLDSKPRRIARSLSSLPGILLTGQR